jgi:DNA repair protein RecN (Recombination protein N)
LAALDRAVIEGSEAEEKLERAAEALSHDPAQLDRIETRLFELRAAARKHHCQVDDLPHKMREMRGLLDGIEGGEAELAALEAAALRPGPIIAHWRRRCQIAARGGGAA